MTGPTAHVGYSTVAGPFGQAREVYHALADQPVTIGVLTRRAGEPLCGAAGAAQDCPPGLFAPAVSCPACLAIAAREGVTVAGAA
ncbi:MAG TPA: hypothetical protein DHU96_28965 [Actinobacteria bacterium]|nr:hypothetical protein [Actinomycetota bacterium]